jgi:hypothetical protein
MRYERRWRRTISAPLPIAKWNALRGAKIINNSALGLINLRNPVSVKPGELPFGLPSVTSVFTATYQG